MSTASADYTAPSFLADFFRLNAWGMFAFSCVAHMVVLFIQQQYIFTNEVYYNTLGEQLTIERIDALLQLRQDWQWLSYVLIPAMLFIQVLLISICLSTGAILFDYKIPFKNIFGVVVNAITVYAIGKILLTFIIQFMDIRTMDDVLRADVFSLIGWVGKDALPDWLLYPVSIANVFEVGFWLLLAGGMGYLLRRRWTTLIGFVAATYGIGLLLWVLFIVFLQLNLQ
ncbi:MAG TPA: hypothetical protein PKC76_08575 [Saprospiraceae bacterium]|nr:hypothetical protein [Saprospiraceae bacterium]HMP24172.1 hypothetical protein [Saprospiraceae bacterium]